MAADGVDELLDNLPHAAYFAPERRQELRGDGEVLASGAPTPATAWRITLLPDGSTGRADGHDALVEAPARDR